jgi:hypothetical protein
VNFCGGHLFEGSQSKMGVTIQELKTFYYNFFNKNGDEFLIKGEEDPKLKPKIIEFIEKFGLSNIQAFQVYLYQVLVEQLNGYEIDVMDEEEFKHIGGPILLNSIKN